MKRSRIEYFLEIAKTVATASTCARRKFGAILVKNGDIISTGYNGSVRGAKNCGDPCLKNLYKEAKYTSYTHCPAIHAEHNTCLNAGRPLAMGSTMFLAKSNDEGMSQRPCQGCRRVMIQTGIKDIYFYDPEGELRHEMVSDWIQMEDKWMIEQEVYAPAIVDSTTETLQLDLTDWVFTDRDEWLSYDGSPVNIVASNTSVQLEWFCDTCGCELTHDEYHRNQGVCPKCKLEESRHESG